MMGKVLTPQESYSILRARYPGKVVKGCVEFSTFYGFYMVDKELVNEKLISSQFVDAVDKNSGRVFEYDIFSDMDAYRSAKNIDLGVKTPRA